MMNIELNRLIVDGVSCLGFNVGMHKQEIEAALGKPLGQSYIETDDVSCYLFEMDNGIIWSINFDKEEVCFEIKLNFDENGSLNFYIRLGQKNEKIDNKTTFERIVDILSYLNLDWYFDIKRMYLQTACIQLQSGIRLYFAFGDKNVGDYGLFSLSFLLESHRFILR